MKGLRFTVYGLLLLTLVGCKTVKVIEQVPVYVHDTAYQTKEVHDSTYIDRWHTIIQKGDTIFVTDEVTKIKYVTKTDTAYKVVEKPVIVSKTETVEVERPLRWWQKMFMYMGLVGLMALIGWIAMKIYRK